MSLVYYIVLGITAVSYLLGLFLSYCEKKERVSILSDTADAGFISVFGGDSFESTDEPYYEKPMMYQKGISVEPETPVVASPYMDEEIL